MAGLSFSRIWETTRINDSKELSSAEKGESAGMSETVPNLTMISSPVSIFNSRDSLPFITASPRLRFTLPDGLLKMKKSLSTPVTWQFKTVSPLPKFLAHPLISVIATHGVPDNSSILSVNDTGKYLAPELIIKPVCDQSCS